MRSSMIGFFGLLALSCAKPCEKLADEVCAILQRPVLCADYRAKLVDASEDKQTECSQKRGIAKDIARDVFKADEIRRFMQASPLVKKIFGARAATANQVLADGGPVSSPPPLGGPVSNGATPVHNPATPVPNPGTAVPSPATLDASRPSAEPKR